jgi:hypothetical protein
MICNFITLSCGIYGVKGDTVTGVFSWYFGFPLSLFHHYSLFILHALIISVKYS